MSVPNERTVPNIMRIDHPAAWTKQQTKKSLRKKKAKEE